MFAACNSTKHIKCELASPHECNHGAYPCPKGIVFGMDSRVYCFEVKEKGNETKD
jgi:hypothetical protein